MFIKKKKNQIDKRDIFLFPFLMNDLLQDILLSLKVQIQAAGLQKSLN